MIERYRDFTVLITTINRSIKKIKTEEMSEFNLRSPHVTCLYYLQKTGGATAKEICEMGQEDKASISRSIEYLEENNYIVCNSTQKKKYNTLLTLTQKGTEIAQKVSDKIDSILNLAGGELDDEKRNIMYECLNIINNNLDKLCKNYEGEN
ncbi:MAG: winged helix-turn-helix transcriptional regulator [Clostridiales bacterium]|nr:winged helix-turn-helix transcriptional regulator [Clostridiales bacterium]